MSVIDDVAWRLFAEDGTRLVNGMVEAKKYCRSVGMDGTKQNLHRQMTAHRKHIEAWMARVKRRGDVMVPAENEGNLVRVLEPTGPVRWLDVNASAMEVGSEALRDIKARLDRGGMEDQDVIRVASLGMTAAHKRGDLESKGRKLSQVDELLKLAAGLPRP